MINTLNTAMENLVLIRQLEQRKHVLKKNLKGFVRVYLVFVFGTKKTALESPGLLWDQLIHNRSDNKMEVSTLK